MSVNGPLSSWFARLRCIGNIAEMQIAETTDHSFELDAKYGYVISICRYISPDGELSIEFSDQLSVFSPPTLSHDEAGFKPLYILIPRGTLAVAFLPSSWEWDQLIRSPLRIEIEEIEEVITYRRRSVIVS